MSEAIQPTPAPRPDVEMLRAHALNILGANPNSVEAADKLRLCNYVLSLERQARSASARIERLDGEHGELLKAAALRAGLAAALINLWKEVQKYNIGYEGSNLLDVMADARTAIEANEGNR